MKAFPANHLEITHESEVTIEFLAIEYVYHGLRNPWVHQEKDDDQCCDQFGL